MKALILASLGLSAVALSACANDYYGPRPRGPSHVDRCLAQHPGYDPRTNLFPGPDGRLHECRKGGW